MSDENEKKEKPKIDTDVLDKPPKTEIIILEKAEKKKDGKEIE